MIFQKKSIALVMWIAIISVITSFLLGNEGVESFYSVIIATGFTFTVSMFGIVVFLFRSHYWLLFKVIGTFLLLPIWCIVMIAVLLPLFVQDFDPTTKEKIVNWWVVASSTISLIFHVFFYQSRKQVSMQENVIRTTSSLLSVGVLFAAYIGYFGLASDFKSLILVVTVNALYVANFIYNETNFLQKVNIWGNRSIGVNNDTNAYAQLAIVGLPYLLPLIFVVLL